MKRRTFLLGAGIGAVTAGIGGFIYFEGFEKTVRKIIEKDTNTLKINKEEIDKFMVAARENKFWKRTYSFAHQQMIKWHYYIDNSAFTLPYPRNYEFYRGRIVAAFLLSTDFFENKMDASKPVRFTAFYDPYVRPCSNPFSNIFYPDSQNS